MVTAPVDMRFRCVSNSMFIVMIVALLAGCSSIETVDQDRLDYHKQLAGELRDNKLYNAAIEEYQAILTFKGLSDAQRANINYLIARIHFADLKDYRNAAAYYMRARALDPEGSFMQEASQNLVASLQKIGNLVDAKRELTSATDVDYQPGSDDDVPIARIDGKPVWRTQLEKEIQTLPPDVQKQFLTEDSKKEFARHYIGVELLYRAALREGYPSHPEIVKQTETLAKKLVVDKYVIDKVIPEIKVDTLDVHNFYLANKESRYDDKPYDSVRAQVFLEYQQEKAQVAYSEYINELAKVENVEFLDGNW